ncbi:MULTISPECIES: FAD binding domain-containing protein [unclassified Mesorhizobium]|uniref:FAD binding domain-containing protein n=1 Tax=unclassified Mesorhizobium TaxID=325217 RepID=UPI0003D028EA|nr:MULTISPECIES: xanthine dehydrogenase family protein subunit M [unclassified Mesorhizobium]ESZ18373.1 carbon-monoxide dehydrogenase [Mesorhizobium sp. L48C026A00]RWN62613.1 MAG: xanthine dehydrogenase family protein subunit M [Mesorhizobium sp.]RWO32756.1 MAG: xanthine dehydrogenase family protein subunit M [Mesorhizobium sp.]TIN81006.1 MAG: xanthine dehydrogenase family protein subunit M [Mesorhizobium sp.]
MKSFDYLKPATTVAAAALLAEHDDAKILAGGMTLLPTMKQSLAAPVAIIDLSAVAALREIAFDEGVLVIGAMARHCDVASSALVRTHIPGLASLAAHIGDPQVRHRGTIGGSAANNDPAADYPAAILALDATVITIERTIPADAFFVDMFETALEAGEIVTGFRVPVPDMAAYAKFRSPASRYAIVGVFVARTAGKVRVAVTGAASSVFRATDIETALQERFDPDALSRVSLDPSGLNSDIHADREYRANLIMVMARRAVAAALRNADESATK